MKPAVSLLALHVLLAPASRAQAAVAFRPEIYAAVAMDADTGKVLNERDMKAPRYPASLTKMMTLYLTFEALTAGQLKLDQPVTVSTAAASREPSKLGVAAGTELALESAILAVVTKSANDMSTVLAEELGGNEAAFATLMTAKARELEMFDTTFYNASGLPHPGHISTAYDMALLSRALIQDFPQYYRYFQERNFHYGGVDYPNQNVLLQAYPGADGIKTGYTTASGHNLAASAKHGDRRVIAVVLGGPTHGWTRQHTSDLLDAGFAGLGEYAPIVVAAPSAPRPVAVAAVAQAPAVVAAATVSEPELAAVKTDPQLEQARALVVAQPATANVTRIDIVPPSEDREVGSAYERIPASGGPSPATETLLLESVKDPSRVVSIPQAGNSGWGVQLGVFNSQGDAQAACQRALAQLPADLRAVKFSVSALSNDAADRRSRGVLIELDESRAREVCAALTRRHIPCFVVPPGREVYVASN